MEYREVELSRGLKALVSVEDYDKVSQYKWHLQKNGKRLYAVAYIKGERVSMHRLLTNAPKGWDVDHKDGDGLNNRQENLRVCTRSENRANTKKYYTKTTTSRYKGVRFRKDALKYSAQIFVEGKYIHLGLFKRAKDAAAQYDRWALYYFGEYARVNFSDAMAASVLR